MDPRIETLLAVAEMRNFTKAAKALSLTQPAVSHHISQMESELGVKLFLRGKGPLKLTQEGEIAIRYAKRMTALYDKMRTEISDLEKNLTKLRIGITHTSESNLITEVLGKFTNRRQGLSLTIITDTIKNLYDMLTNYEIDLAIVEGTPVHPALHSLMLGTDFLVCVLSKDHPLAEKAMVSLSDLKKERMILRLPSSATRMLFESTLNSLNESIDHFNVIIEVDNIATIKDLVKKNLGISILPKSACLNELRKNGLSALPIENLSMLRETKLVYSKDFTHPDILQELAGLYRETANE